MLKDTVRAIGLALVLLAAVSATGCAKSTSRVLVEELELCSATALSVSNPFGNVSISGAELNNLNGIVTVKTETYVEVFSLFGLASPESYLEKVATQPVMNEEGRVEIQVAMAPRGLLDRLSARVVPHVNRVVEGPTLISTEASLQVGDLELRNLPGDVQASVSVGKLKMDAPGGVWGRHDVAVDIGEVSYYVSPDSSFDYDFVVDLGKTEAQGVDLDINAGLVGARASGIVGPLHAPGELRAKVKLGRIEVIAQ
ncbi:MAG: hypothetical protein GX117_02190 [Candidatus Hydrogenedentes bacterium]|nr:hypothetical protein [Candidatus Hydrogenedentota bacterium]